MAIKNLLHKNWVVSLRHNFREGNDAAGYLAKKGDMSDNSHAILYEVPPNMVAVLLAYVMGVEFVRP